MIKEILKALKWLKEYDGKLLNKMRAEIESLKLNNALSADHETDSN